jgi:adenine C2-methylase RlmN of 23S rRNA A2503 and tRNA A37
MTIATISKSKVQDLSFIVSGKNLIHADWEAFLKEIGEKRFRVQQIFGWIYRQRVRCFGLSQAETIKE